MCPPSVRSHDSVKRTKSMVSKQAGKDVILASTIDVQLMDEMEKPYMLVMQFESRM